MPTSLPSVRNTEVKGKRVLLRVDFNVVAENGKIEEVYRIKRALPTIKFLKDNGAKIIILSHLSPKKGKSLRPVAEYLNKKIADLKIDFIESLDLEMAKKRISAMKDGDIVILENIRMQKGEESNDRDFARSLAGLGDVFVNDAFGVSHRKHASVFGIVEFLPSFIGLLFEEEVAALKTVFKPEHPFLLILGGVKFGSKLGVLDKFLNIADKIFIGGALANGFLKFKGEDIGNSFFDDKVDYKKYLGNEKIILPADTKRKNGIICDVGPKTNAFLRKLIKEARFVVWNGPMGKIEEDGFSEGTKAIAEAIAEAGVKSIIGGGDTVSAVEKMGILDKFSFVSTGGGAMLEFLASGTLPGIEAIISSNKN